MNLDRFGSIALLTAVLSCQGIELSESKADSAKIDFKFVESDLVVTRSFQISKDTKPIEIKN